MPYSDPWNATNPFPWEPGAPDCVDFWGVTWTWPEGTPGAFPRHGDGFTVLEDVEEWKGRVKCPPLEYSDELWEAAKKDYASYDRSQAQRRRQRQFWRDMGHPGLRWRDSPP